MEAQITLGEKTVFEAPSCEGLFVIIVRPLVAECNDSTADIVFALDASGSISRDDFERVVQFVGAVVQSLTIRSDLTPNGFQVALVSFADDVDVRFNLSTYTDKELMLAAVNVPYTRGRTNLDQALRYTHSCLPFHGEI